MRRGACYSVKHRTLSISLILTTTMKQEASVMLIRWERQGTGLTGGPIYPREHKTESSKPNPQSTTPAEVPEKAFLPLYHLTLLFKAHFLILVWSEKDHVTPRVISLASGYLKGKCGEWRQVQVGTVGLRIKWNDKQNKGREYREDFTGG